MCGNAGTDWHNDTSDPTNCFFVGRLVLDADIAAMGDIVWMVEQPQFQCWLFGPGNWGYLGFEPIMNKWKGTKGVIYDGVHTHHSPYQQISEVSQ